MLNVFDYLTVYEAWMTFSHLNSRLHHLLHNNIKHVDLSGIRRAQFDFMCQSVLRNIIQPFALRFSLKFIPDSIDDMFIEL